MGRANNLRRPSLSLTPRRPFGSVDRIDPASEDDSKDFRPLPLGVIDLPAGPGTLRLRATAIPGKSVADVRRLVLVPVRD